MSEQIEEEDTTLNADEFQTGPNRAYINLEIYSNPMVCILACYQK